MATGSRGVEAVSDEELARRLQEEEQAAARAGTPDAGALGADEGGFADDLPRHPRPRGGRSGAGGGEGGALLWFREVEEVKEGMCGGWR